MRRTRRNKRSGSAIVEATLLVPWFFLMFAGVLDFGFYAYSLIATQNAARVAALYTSSSESAIADAATACEYVRREMSSLPNTRTLTNCSALPLKLELNEVTEGAPPHKVSQVTVTYQTVQLFPIPGMTGRLTAVRRVSMRLKAG